MLLRWTSRAVKPNAFETLYINILHTLHSCHVQEKQTRPAGSSHFHRGHAASEGTEPPKDPTDPPNTQQNIVPMDPNTTGARMDTNHPGVKGRCRQTNLKLNS